MATLELLTHMEMQAEICLVCRVEVDCHHTDSRS